MKKLVWIVAGALAGCTASTAAPEETTAAEPAAETEATSGAETAPTAAPASQYEIAVVDDHLEIPEKIQFATDSDVILEQSFPLLDAIAQTIAANPQIRAIKVVGHTDITGQTSHNQELSLRRARSVVSYLVGKGAQIDLEAYGLGEDEPLCRERTADCHATNRRVEFIITETR